MAAAKRAPKGFAAAGRTLWRQVNTVLGDELELDERSLAVLAMACRQLDDVARLEAVLEADAAIVEGSQGQPRLSAVFAEVRQSRLAVARLLGQLDLTDETAAGSDTVASERARKAANARHSRARIADLAVARARKGA